MADFSKQQINALIIILASYLLILLDASIVITGLPEIQSDLGFSSVTLSWVQNAYTLCFGSLLLVGARAGDLLGRRRVYLFAVALFALSSLVIGLAQSPGMMIAARAVQGMSAAVLAPSTLSLLSLYFKEGEERVKALSLYGATAGIGATLGLVLGGVFAGWFSWRVGFLVNVPLGAILFFAAKKRLDETPKQDGQLDILGALLSTAGMSCLIYGIIQAAQLGWQSLDVASYLAVSALLLVMFVIWEAKTPAPMMPLRLFASRERSAAYLSRMTFIGAMIGFFFFATQFMQNVLGFTPVEAGIGFVPMTTLTFVSSVLVPKLTRTIGTVWVCILAFGLLITGIEQLSQLTPESLYLSDLFLPMCLIGLGNGAALGPLTVSGVSGVEDKDAGAASGVVNVAHQMGGTLGLSLLVLVYAAAADPQLEGSAQLAQQIDAGFRGATWMLAFGVLTLVAGNLPMLLKRAKRKSVTP